MSTTESSGSAWLKVLVPVILTACIALAAALWNQSTTVATLEHDMSAQSVQITEFKSRDNELGKEVADLRTLVSELKTDVKQATGTQDKVLEVVDRLSSTLVRLEVAMGKLETKLEYGLKGN